MLHFKYCMKKIALLFFTGILAVASLGIQSCVKKGNDVPEDQTNVDPKLQVTHTIAQLLNMPLNAAIQEEVIISGVVVMDDRSGNYYKSFVIQDETGGIEIKLDQNNIYNDYPVGRKVYLKCKGLTLGAYGGLKQIGYGIDERQSVVAIPFVMADLFIVKANYPNEIKVDTFTYDELADVAGHEQYLNKLVAIKDVQFAEEAAGIMYSQPNSATSRKLEGCGASNSNIVLRTSQYARFQGVKTPTGSGTIVAIYTKFSNASGSSTTPQLVIRDTTDVQFGPERCGGAPIPGVSIFAENFDGGVKPNPINLSGWVNFAEVGGKEYIYDGNSNLYAKITAYQSGQADVKSWLVTPAINLSGYNSYDLKVSTTYGFPDAATFKAYISDNFTGDPTTATWVALDEITVPGLNNWSWQVVTVAIPSSFNSKQVHIAFKYEGSATNGASGTYELDNVNVMGNQ